MSPVRARYPRREAREPEHRLTAKPGGPDREEGDSSMSIELVPLDEAVTRALRGELPDAKTIVGLLFAERRLTHHEPG